MSVRVEAIRKIRGRIAIEAASEKERGEILKCKKFAEIGLEARIPRKVRSKLIIFDVPSRLREESILKGVIC